MTTLGVFLFPSVYICVFTCEYVNICVFDSLWFIGMYDFFTEYHTFLKYNSQIT